jgi:hypothetical protein
MRYAEAARRAQGRAGHAAPRQASWASRKAGESRRGCAQGRGWANRVATGRATAPRRRAGAMGEQPPRTRRAGRGEHRGRGRGRTGRAPRSRAETARTEAREAGRATGEVAPRACGAGAGPHRALGRRGRAAGAGRRGRASAREGKGGGCARVEEEEERGEDGEEEGDEGSPRGDEGAGGQRFRTTGELGGEDASCRGVRRKKEGKRKRREERKKWLTGGAHPGWRRRRLRPRARRAQNAGRGRLGRRAPIRPKAGGGSWRRLGRRGRLGRRAKPAAGEKGGGKEARLGRAQEKRPKRGEGGFFYLFFPILAIIHH